MQVEVVCSMFTGDSNANVGVVYLRIGACSNSVPQVWSFQPVIPRSLHQQRWILRQCRNFLILTSPFAARHCSCLWIARTVVATLVGSPTEFAKRFTNTSASHFRPPPKLKMLSTGPMDLFKVSRLYNAGLPVICITQSCNVSFSCLSTSLRGLSAGTS